MSLFKFKPVVKISLSACFIALSIILTKLLSIQNIAAIPFIRISLGPTMIMSSGLILGPIYGVIIGFFSDLLGCFTFDSTGFPYNPLFSITYMGYGLLPGIILFLIKKNKKIAFPIIQSLFFIVLDSLFISFLCRNDSFKLYSTTYNLTPQLKVILFMLIFIVTILYFLIYYFIYQKYKNKEERVKLNNFSLISLVTLFTFQLIIGSLIKTSFFEVDFFFLFISQLVATMIEIFLSTYLMLLIINILSKRFNSFLRINN